MTREIMEVGPEIGLVARRMQVFKETLRYRFNKHLLERGFVVQANLDYQKLGLKRLVVIARIAQPFERHADAVMAALNETCYLTEFAETTLEGLRIMQVTVPAQLRDDCVGLYEWLRGIGIFSEVQILPFEEVRNVPMKPEYYDFSNGTWAYDWQGDEVSKVTLAQSAKSDPEKYDISDLLILRELDIDANQTLVGIAKAVGLSHKTVLYHYKSHVLRRGLIRDYRVTWQSTRYGQNEKALSKRHSYLEVAVLVRGPTDGQRAKLTASLNRVPFLLVEASDPDYYAELFVPVDSYADFLMLLREVTVRTGTRPQVYVLDRSKSLKYAMPCNLYDVERRQWRLNTADFMARFEGLMVNVNGRGVGLD